MKKKVISALLCITMISSMLIGCGGSGDAAETPAKAEEAESSSNEEAPARKIHKRLLPQKEVQRAVLSTI